MDDPAVHDIHDVHHLLEGAASLHNDLRAAGADPAATGSRDDHAIIESFMGLIRDFQPRTPRRPRLVAA